MDVFLSDIWRMFIVRDAWISSIGTFQRANRLTRSLLSLYPCRERHEMSVKTWVGFEQFHPWSALCCSDRVGIKIVIVMIIIHMVKGWWRSTVHQITTQQWRYSPLEASRHGYIHYKQSAKFLKSKVVIRVSIFSHLRLLFTDTTDRYDVLAELCQDRYDL